MPSRKQLIHHLGEFDRLASAPAGHQLAWVEQVRPLFLVQRDPLLKARFLLRVGSLGDTVRPIAQVTDDLLLALRVFRSNGMEPEAARCLARLTYWLNRRDLPTATLLVGRMALDSGGLSWSERIQLVIPMCLAAAAQRHLPAAWSLVDELTASLKGPPQDPRAWARVDGARASLHFIEAVRSRRIASLYGLDLPPGGADPAASDRHLDACAQHLQAYERAGLVAPAATALRAMSAALRGDALTAVQGLVPPEGARTAHPLSEVVRLYNLGWCQRVLGRPDLALDTSGQALQLLAHHQDNRTHLLLLYDLSLCAQATGQLDLAHRHLTDYVHASARLATLDVEATQALLGSAQSPPQGLRTLPVAAAVPAAAAAAVHLRASEPACLARAERLYLAQLPRRPLLTRLAAQVGVSLRTLQAAAQSYRGMTLTEMLRRSLMAEARRLLRDTSLSLREIAARCGHGDPSTFSRDFKRVYGTAPSVHRATLGDAVAPGSSPVCARRPQGWD